MTDGRSRSARLARAVGEGRSQGPASGVPARGYSWPPFEPGNTVSMRHGFFSSPRLRPEDSAEVDEISVAVWELLPAGHRLPSFAPAVEGLACRIWQARRAYADLAEHGLLRGDDRQPAPILRYLGTLERTIQRDLEGLGLTPRAWAELGLDLTRARGEALRQHLAERYGSEEPGE